MPKAKTDLVIVESPSKAKTIGKYLGSDYQVKACMGHLRDLPKSTMGVDLENDFTPAYQPVKGKEDIINELKKCVKNSDKVYLATDPDREGEAISWHLQALLGLEEGKVNRVTFNEITKGVVTKAIQEPRAIDQDLVDAQQARRILDRIVGYQLSPLLWKKVRRGLSAGRVQSVATRLVVDREEEIRAFVPQEYWTIDVTLERVEKPGSFTARFYGDPKKRDLTDEAQVKEVLNSMEGVPFHVSSVKRTQKKRSPAPPFITSTLQQEASRKLGMTPKRTMAIAQQLYEGIEISGIGAVGLITYMRTDSLRISEEALAAAKDYILGRWGAAYYYGEPHRYKTKSAAQDAHEAIRPSDVRLDPDRVRADLNKDQFRLYKLIWDRFTASQMACAVYDNVAIESTCGKNVFRANHQSLRFAGFTALYEEGRDDEQEELQSPLPDLAEGEPLKRTGTKPEQHFTAPPARYTEATLVRAMEEQGVGRPSTYASIISTIQDRDYVIKKEKRLWPTPLGEVVTGLMKERFQGIIDVAFTAQMEQKLDQVEEGTLAWKSVLGEFYADFKEDMENAEAALDGVRLKVPDEETDEICEVCGRNMVIKNGRFGRFLACPGFPECTNTRAIVEHMPGRCPKCGSGMLKRKSKRGFAYYSCEKGVECGFMSWDVPTELDCPTCGQSLFKKSGRGAMKPFCINEACPDFLPEDKRGYRKKPAASVEAAEAEAAAEEAKAPAKKPAAKKPSAKKTTAKKTTAKKTTAKKTAAKKTAAAKKETK
ncbi:MAG: type I DNA topoisomerase [Oscillospiraceae bacterium]|nr:type I DNA topoisomerase [Oscillospiraceae bacterium]